MDTNKEFDEVKPIRQSVAALVVRLTLLLFLVDTTYALLFLLVFWIRPPESLHYAAFSIFWAMHLVKYLVLTYLMIKLVVQWSSRFYYVTGHHLVLGSEAIRAKEERYELDQLKTVEVEQDWLGKKFNYGTLTLKIAASGFSETVSIVDIKNPGQCERMLAKYY